MEKLDIDNIGLYLKELVIEVKKHIGADEIMIISTALSMMSTVLGNKIHTYSGARQRLNPNVWMLLVAQSGLGSKSTTIKAVNEMILEPILINAHKKYQQEKKKYNALSKNEKEKTNPPSFNKPLSGQGSTFQGMIKSMEKNSHGMLSIYDEAGEFLKKFSKDTEQKSALISLYDQKYYGKDLVGSGGGESIYIENPFLSILAVTNPHSLIEETTETDYLSGFLNRFSIVEIKGSKRPTPFKTKEASNNLKFQTIALNLWNDIQKNYTSKNPFILETDEIEQEYIAWYNKQFDKYENDAEYMTSFLMRQVTSALKYAMIIQLFDNIFNGKQIEAYKNIKIEYLRIGCYLSEKYIEAFKEHIKSIGLNDSDGYAETKNVNKIKKLAEKINRYLTKNEHLDGSFMRSDLTNNIRGLYAKNFEEAIDYVLEKYNYISVFTSSNGKKVDTYYTAKSQDENSSLDNYKVYPSIFDDDDVNELFEDDYVA